MKFQQLLDGAEVLARAGDSEVSGLEYDSHCVQPGCAFVAMRGESSDGNRYIDAALRQGAVTVVSDDAAFQGRPGLAWARVAHGRRALARLSANFYGQPAAKLAITGVTGTNGKSTTTFLLECILAAQGRGVVLVGTIAYHVGGRILPAPHTTPESLELNRLFAEAVRAGATEAVMEVSSHALAQERTYGIGFDVAVFTNLTRDHLDYHRTFDEYFAAKQKLFEGSGTEPPRVAVLNAEDEYGARLAQESKARKSEVITYGITRGDFRARELEVTLRGTRFRMITPEGDVEMFSPLIGRVNVYNVLAAAAAAYARDGKPEAMARGVGALQRVPGRFEQVNCEQPFTVVVDYAHTDDALRNLTALAREFVSQKGRKGRVITLFGCGGDRDRVKRPLMGEAAGKCSDFVVLTSDNPRSEDPLMIMNDAMTGLQRTGTRYVMEPDRKKAIAIAIQEARAGDIVLIAGKGHEKMQVLHDGAFPFDDVEIAREVLRAAGYSCEPAREPLAAGGAL
jgi:UDP-N-acetylmuramoyl-L-alanyl-D-glutamate--2,6-diaminopimelate ligase